MCFHKYQRKIPMHLSRIDYFNQRHKHGFNWAFCLSAPGSSLRTPGLLTAGFFCNCLQLPLLKVHSFFCSLQKKHSTFLQEIKGIAFSPWVQGVIHRVLRCLLSRQKQWMYKIVSFPDIHLRFTILLSLSPLLLYHLHHPRNKDVCQADIITIFANICYRPISML